VPLDEHTPQSVKSRPAALLATVARSKITLLALVAVVILAVAGATYGYQTMSTTVTLSVDGEEREVSVLGSTVEEVLDKEGIEIGEHDVVQPELDEEISDGSRIAVRYGRQIELTVDGEQTTHWVTATSVDEALGQIGALYRDARLSTSRGATIDRGGLSLEVVTPKQLTVTLAGKKPRQVEVTALTVRDALKQLDVKLDRHDKVSPKLSNELEDGDKVRYVDIDVRTKQVKGEAITAETITREDDSSPEGTETVVREGEAGSRDVTYRVVVRNGEVVERTIVRQRVIEAPVAQIVEVGTQEEVASPNYAGGNTVWDQLAQCESGGNWAINTGNGYYGGLQFSLGTWQAYGGTGLPSNASRETQIAIAEKVRAATGGYGSWPACSASLGLPQ
jgi:uncharacterized protein YabE (DUF348 family)